MILSLAAAALALQPTPGPFTIVFERGTTARTLHPEGRRVVTEVVAALQANPEAAVIIESRGWGGFEGHSIAQCFWARVARRALIAQSIAAERVAIRGPRHMAWQRAPRDTLQEPRQPQLDFRLGNAAEAANVRVMPDSS